MTIISILVAFTVVGLCEASSWPDGRYCLPMPENQQCPSGWQKGYRKHDTEDSNTSCHLKKQGKIPYNSHLCENLQWGFCCKTRRNYLGKTWPKGHYCIFRYGGTCPTGFDSGSIYWDDEDNNNDNSRSGTLPDGVYGANTKIFSCCRHDGGHYRFAILFGRILFSWYNQLTNLPKCSEITLMRYRGDCPTSVDGYRGPQTGFLQWDTQDTNNGDIRHGKHPDGKTDFWTGHKIEFCSYTSDSTC